MLILYFTYSSSKNHTFDVMRQRGPTAWMVFGFCIITLLGISQLSMSLRVTDGGNNEIKRSTEERRPLRTLSPQTSSKPKKSTINSSIKCTGNNVTLSSKVYGNHIVNRSCVYTNLLLYQRRWYFVTDDSKIEIPDVSLPSKPILVGKKSFKNVYPAAWRAIQFSYRWHPSIIPSQNITQLNLTTIPGLTAMYSPEVAPWNYAHTLFNDLFPLFWGMQEHGISTLDTRLLVYGALYNQPFQPDRHVWLPKNNAFPSFTRGAVHYDQVFAEECLNGCLIEKLLVGSGTRTWSFVTDDYASPGSLELWANFRAHILKVLRIDDRNAKQNEGKIQMTICDKRGDKVDAKRGIINARETATWIESEHPNVNVTPVVLTSLTIRKQTELLVNSDIYMCNEGTMGTAFFLMPPGSVWLSVMNIFRRAASFDLYRPFSQKQLFWNTGGNIDWFAPTIKWIKALHYDRLLLSDVVADTTPGNYRNYLPNWSIRIVKQRILPLITSAVSHITSSMVETDTDNHSVMGRMCSLMMNKDPSIRPLFTSTKCAYGMSWFCEYLVNGDVSLRRRHPKFKKCGVHVSPKSFNIKDPRDDWLIEESIDEDPRGFNCTQPVPETLCKHGNHPCCVKDDKKL